MILLEFIASSVAIFWIFVIIVVYQYQKNIGKTPEESELPQFEINVKDSLKEVIREMQDDIIKKINIVGLKNEIKKDLVEELNKFRDNLVNFVDVFEKKITQTLPEIKLPDMSLIQAKIDEFKVPEITSIKEEIRTEIKDAFNDENVEKIAQSVLKTLSESMGKDPQGAQEGMNMENFDMNSMLKMFAMQYMQKFMGNIGGSGGPSLGPSTTSSSKTF